MALAEHVKELALAGDVEAARIASDAIGLMLGTVHADASMVVDLGRARHALRR